MEEERKEEEKREAARKEAQRRAEEERKAAEWKAAAEREAARKEKERREREMAQIQAQEVKAAQCDIAKYKAAEEKAQDRDIELKRAIEQEVTKRKATDEAEEERASSKGKFKAPRIPGEAISSEAPLTVEELLGDFDKPTQPQNPAPKELAAAAKSLINEDEMLLSSARLAAHTLSQGRLFHRDVAPHFRSSVSSSSPSPHPASTRSKSLSSVAERDRALVNGYDVALAPSAPLGLGRSLSRTEQRIRSTGAKGLAGKPISSLLQSSGTKEASKRKSKKSKKGKFTSAES